MPAYKLSHMGHLKVVHPNTGSGGNYHIFIDNDYRGNVIKLKDHWVADIGDSCDLTPDEVKALGKIIDGNFGKPTL